MKTTARLSILVLLAAAFLALQCKRTRSVPDGTVPGNVTVRLPPGCPLQAGDLTVLSGVYDKADVSNGGQVRLGLVPDAASVLVAVAHDSVPELLSVVVSPSDEQTVIMDARSTAVTLVYLHPLVVQSEVAYANDVLSIVQNLPEVDTLANLVDSRLSSDAGYMQRSDSVFAVALLGAVKAVVAQIDSVEETIPARKAARVNKLERVSLAGKNKAGTKVVSPGRGASFGDLTIYPDEPISGISLRPEVVSSTQYRVWIKNSRRRHLYSYCNDLGTTVDSALVWSSGRLTLIPPSFGKPESNSVLLDVAQHPQVCLRTYGAGSHSIEEWKADWARGRVVTPAVATCLFNFTVPLLSVATGLPGIFGKGTQTGLALNREIAQDGVTIAKVIDCTERKSLFGALWAVGTRALAIVTDNPQRLVAAAAEAGMTIKPETCVNFPSKAGLKPRIA